MTIPGNFTPIVSRGDAQALMPEQASSVMESRRSAATRGQVCADGSVRHVSGRHIGHVYRTSGMAWRARTPHGKQLGLHTSRQEAVGALVRHHEGRS